MGNKGNICGVLCNDYVAEHWVSLEFSIFFAKYGNLERFSFPYGMMFYI